MEIFFPGRHNTKLHPIQKVLTNTHLESIPPKQCANGSSSSLIINSSNSGGEQQLLVVVYKIHSRGKKDHVLKSTRTHKLQVMYIGSLLSTKLTPGAACNLCSDTRSHKRLWGQDQRDCRRWPVWYCRACHKPDYTVAQNGAIKSFGAKSGAFCLSIQRGCHYSTC